MFQITFSIDKLCIAKYQFLRFFNPFLTCASCFVLITNILLNTVFDSFIILILFNVSCTDLSEVSSIKSLGNHWVIKYRIPFFKSIRLSISEYILFKVSKIKKLPLSTFAFNVTMDSLTPIITHSEVYCTNWCLIYGIIFEVIEEGFCA